MVSHVDHSGFSHKRSSRERAESTRNQEWPHGDAKTRKRTVYEPQCASWVCGRAPCRALRLEIWIRQGSAQGEAE